MPGAPLSLPERDEISVALIENPDVAWSVIARRTGRHRTTIAREVEGHGGRHHYRPATAQRSAERARSRPRQRTLQVPGPLRDRITAELASGRSPVAIRADLAAEEATDIVCVETIYTSLYDGVLDVKPRDCLRQRRPRRRSRQARNPTRRHILANIWKRPDAANDRTEIGHWEGDQIIGKNNRSSMLCLTERVTRHSILVTMPEGYSADAMVAGLADGLDRIPAHLLKSITFDQGSEWANRQTIADSYSIDIWFCDLFQGARPTITSKPATVAWNSLFQVETPDPADVTSVALVRPSAVTHATDMNQRYVPLSFTVTATGLQVRGPANGGEAPPGDYMLVIENGAGVPSVGEFLRLGA